MVRDLGRFGLNLISQKRCNRRQCKEEEGHNREHDEEARIIGLGHEHHKENARNNTSRLKSQQEPINPDQTLFSKEAVGSHLPNNLPQGEECELAAEKPEPHNQSKRNFKDEGDSLRSAHMLKLTRKREKLKKS